MADTGAKARTKSKTKVQAKEPQSNRLNVLHKRVKHLAELRRAQLEPDLAGQYPSGDFVWIGNRVLVKLD